MRPTRRQRSYDHRLVQLVQQTRDPSIATRLGVPRSTAAGWIRRAPRPVTTEPRAEATFAELRVRVARLEDRVRRLGAVLRVLLALLRALRPDLSRLRLPAQEKARLLRAVERTRGVLRLRRVLSILGLSAARLHAWRRAAQGCELEDEPSCPGSSPYRLTPKEISKVRQMVTSPDLRHVPTGQLAILAQRIGAVLDPPRRGTDSFASGDGAARAFASTPTIPRSASAPRDPTRSGTSTRR